MTRDLVQEGVAILECGEICDIDTEPTAPGSFVPVLRKQLSCQNVMFRMLSSCPAIDWPPPNDPPDELLDAYTMGGKVELLKYRDTALAQRYSGKKAMTPTWTEDYIKTLCCFCFWATFCSHAYCVFFVEYTLELRDKYISI